MTPMFEPVGGVVKVFDYVNHAIAFGYEPIIACPERYREGLPLFTNPRFSKLTPDSGIKYIDLEQVSTRPRRPCLPDLADPTTRSWSDG